MISDVERGLHRFRDIGHAFETQHDNSFVGTVALPPLTSYVIHLLPCIERLRGTNARSIGTIDLRKTIVRYHDVYSWNCVFQLVSFHIHLYEEVCITCFFLNIPNTMSFRLFNKRFRLLFVGVSWVGERMSIDNISCGMDFTPPFYHDLYFER